MAFFMVEDFTGSVRMVAFADVFEKHKELIENDAMVLVSGTLDRKNESDENNILVAEIIPLEEAREKCAKRLAMNLHTPDMEEDGVNRIHFLLKKYRGTCPVYFNVAMADHGDLLMKSKKYRVNPHSDLVKDLRLILGNDNVWIEG